MGRITPERIVAAERRSRALELRRDGHTYEQIANAVGYSSRATAYKAVQQGLGAITQEPAQSYRTVELERLDRMTQGLSQRAFEGDTQAIAAMLKIMDRRAKLLGLDVPHGRPHASEGRDKSEIIQVVFDSALGGKRRTEPEVEVDAEE